MKKILFALSFAITLSTLTYSLQAAPYSGGAWKKDSVGWSYGYDEGFYLSNCWFTDNERDWYYFNSSGYIAANQWLELFDNEGKHWYYFAGNGKMVSNQWVGDYYLGENGAMLTNKMTPDGFWVDENGKWMPGGNNLSGLTGKFNFSLIPRHDSIGVDILKWDGDTLHIGGFMSRDFDDLNLGYTEEYLEVTDSTKPPGISDAGIDGYMSKETFKKLLKPDAGVELFIDVYNGNIIGAGLSN